MCLPPNTPATIRGLPPAAKERPLRGMADQLPRERSGRWASTPAPQGDGPDPSLPQFVARINTLERYWTELTLIAGSLWVGAAFATGPQDLGQGYSAGQGGYGGYFHLLEAMCDSAQAWGAFTLLAAGLKATGLGLCLASSHRGKGLGLPIRCLGLGMSGFFWITAGASSLTTNPRSIGGALMLMMGLSAWRVLLRFPSMPDPRQTSDQGDGPVSGPKGPK